MSRRRCFPPGPRHKVGLRRIGHEASDLGVGTAAVGGSGGTVGTEAGADVPCTQGKEGLNTGYLGGLNLADDCRGTFPPSLPCRI